MAAQLSQEQVNAAMASAKSDLKSFVGREGVDKGFQASLYHAGITRLKNCASFHD